MTHRHPFVPVNQLMLATLRHVLQIVVASVLLQDVAYSVIHGILLALQCIIPSCSHDGLCGLP